MTNTEHAGNKQDAAFKAESTPVKTGWACLDNRSLTAETLRKNQAAKEAFLNSLSLAELEVMATDWGFWARDDQLPPLDWVLGKNTSGFCGADAVGVKHARRGKQLLKRQIQAYFYLRGDCRRSAGHYDKRRIGHCPLLPAVFRYGL